MKLAALVSFPDRIFPAKSSLDTRLWLPLLPYPISNAVLGSLVVLVDGEELHCPSPPALVNRSGLRQGQNLSTQQVSLHDRRASHNKTGMEWGSDMGLGTRLVLAWNREGLGTRLQNGGRGPFTSPPSSS